MKEKFSTGIEISWSSNPLEFKYGPSVFGPDAECRSLNSIRQSLLDPDCAGPDPVYAIAMDVGKEEHRSILQERNLLFGVVTYAAGRLGREPVRSQGHVHGRARNNKLAPPEIYEIWSGRAIVYMQEKVADDPGRCFAVEAGQGDVVIVPPDWAHATVSADPDEPLTYGAFCDRDYSFEYAGIRAHGGLAWFPLLDENGSIDWIPNNRYLHSSLTRKSPEEYRHLGIVNGSPIYEIFENNPDIFLYVANPELSPQVWKSFIP
jgi:glucose-6-phosphate isomerase, archaeal